MQTRGGVLFTATGKNYKGSVAGARPVYAARIVCMVVRTICSGELVRSIIHDMFVIAR